MVLSPRPLSTLLLVSLVPVASWFVVRPLLDPVPPLPGLFTSFGFSLFAFLAALYFVPAVGPRFVQANLKGRDLLKTYPDPMSVRYYFVVIAGKLRVTQTRKYGARLRLNLHSALDTLHSLRLLQYHRESFHRQGKRGYICHRVSSSPGGSQHLAI